VKPARNDHPGGAPLRSSAETLLAGFSNAGAKVVVITAKDKLRTLLGKGMKAVCFSAEKADQLTQEKNGITGVLELVGKPLPKVYSADLSEFVFAAGVNIMAMDFGVPSAARNMRGAITSSMTATQEQLAAIYNSAGTRLDSAHLWHKLGVTVMIGQNDVAGERVSVSDAKAVTSFAAKYDLGRVSMWSLNRDSQCGVTFALIGTHSNLCSGVAQRPLQFTKTFVTLHGNARATSAAVTTTDLLPEAPTATADNPAKSPYPIWQPTLAYRENYKVVWHQAVYIAKWYSEGQTPDSTNVARSPSTSRRTGRSDATTGVPQASASTVGRPKPSSSEGNTSA